LIHVGFFVVLKIDEIVSKFNLYVFRLGLHNSESSKGQIIKINLPRAAKVYLISMWRFHCSMEEVLQRQLLIRGRAFATYSTIEKALARRMLCRPCFRFCR